MSTIWEALRSKNAAAIRTMIAKKAADVNETGAVRKLPAAPLLLVLLLARRAHLASA